MKSVMLEIAGQMMSGNFALEEQTFNEMEQEYLALVKTTIDIINGAEYFLMDKENC